MGITFWLWMFAASICASPSHALRWASATSRRNRGLVTGRLPGQRFGSQNLRRPAAYMRKSSFSSICYPPQTRACRPGRRPRQFLIPRPRPRDVPSTAPERCRDRRLRHAKSKMCPSTVLPSSLGRIQATARVASRSNIRNFDSRAAQRAALIPREDRDIERLSL
jgi:hypothetical protein